MALSDPGVIINGEGNAQESMVVAAIHCYFVTIQQKKSLTPF